MFKLPQARKDSEHRDFYESATKDERLNKMITQTEKNFEQADLRSEEEKRDDLYKFKKSVSLTRNYELYLETEKAYHKFTKEKL